MSIIKNYTVASMAKKAGFAEMVSAIQKAHPVMTLRAARAQAANQMFAKVIRDAGQKESK